MTKESRLYLNYFKSFWLLFVFTLVIGAAIAVYSVSQKPRIFVSERMFQFEYNEENAAVVEKETEQVVSVLRSGQLKESLGLQSTELRVFKPGPFSITLQVKSEKAENSVNNLSKISGFLTQNYKATEIGRETFAVENPNYVKYLFIGLLGGSLMGLMLSLSLSYLKNY